MAQQTADGAACVTVTNYLTLVMLFGMQGVMSEEIKAQINLIPH